MFEDTRGAKACANWEEYNKGCGRRHGFSAVQSHGVDDQRLGLLAMDHWKLVEWEPVGQGDMKIPSLFLFFG